MRRTFKFQLQVKYSIAALMWSETVGLSTRPVWDQKIGLGLGLADLVLLCETRSCHARRHNDLEGHSNFSSTIL